ncbi:MAG: hypothetical protein ABW213_13340 [Tardiphaga sp.]
MGDNGIGGIQLWMWLIGLFALGGALLYGTMKSGRLRRSERAQLDRNTEEAQRRDDPQKRKI